MKLENLTTNRETDELATVVHGMLFGFHALGIYYNLRRGKYVHATAHALVSVYDLICAFQHRGGSDYLEKIRKRGL